jgi:hypothetical protein
MSSLLSAVPAYSDADQCCNLSNGRAPHYIHAMAQTVQRGHFVDKQLLDRLNTVVVLVLVGSGLAACVIGAFTYDVGRWLSAW